MQLGVTLPEVGQDLLGRAVVDGLAASGQDEDLVRPVDVVLVVRDHDDRAPRVARPGAVRETREQVHDVAVELGVEAGRRLVEEQQ